MAECAPVRRGSDRHRYDVIPKVSVACHRHLCEVWGRADAVGIFSAGLEENRERFADLPIVKDKAFGAIKSSRMSVRFLTIAEETGCLIRRAAVPGRGE